MLLQRVTATRNIRIDFISVHESYTAYLAHGRVRLSWSRRIHTDADAPLLRIAFQCNGRTLLNASLSRFTNQLIYGRQL